jgi:excisionase family DNA binding protein
MSLKLLTIGEACNKASISRATLYRLIKSRALVPVKLGRAVRIPSDEFECFLESLKEARDAA